MAQQDLKEIKVRKAYKDPLVYKVLLAQKVTLVIRASEVKQALQVQMVKVHGEIKATMKKVLIITLETMLLGMVVFTLK